MPVSDETADNNSVSRRKPLPSPIPARISMWERMIKQERTLNDLIEDVHRVLVDENEKYRGYLYATYDEQAVEGSLSADNIKAAELIREKAVEVGNREVAQQKLATIVKALGVVLRRYNQSRKQRRRTVGGEAVPDIDNGE